MIGEAVRLIRKFHDQSQKDAAKSIGISVSYLSEIEKGRKTPNLDTLKKIADNFNLPLSSLMFFSENLENPERSSKARDAVAKKILTILKFISERSRDADEESQQML